MRYGRAIRFHPRKVAPNRNFNDAQRLRSLHSEGVREHSPGLPYSAHPGKPWSQTADFELRRPDPRVRTPSFAQ